MRVCCLPSIAAALSFLAGSGVAQTLPADEAAYRVELDIWAPDRARFVLRTPSAALILATPDNASIPSMPPACGSAPLAPITARQWVKPAGCTSVSWAAFVPRLEGTFDATRPAPFWSDRHRLWLLTGALPWLRYHGQPDAPVRIRAALGGHSLHIRDARLPREASAPVYIAIGAPVRQCGAGPVRLETYGSVPLGANHVRLHQQVAAVLQRWREDVLPDDSPKRAHFSYVWIDATKGADPGVFASTGSDAILMQFVPDPHSPRPLAKLEAAILLTGAHEGFHALSGPLSSGKPEWVSESWASYFAYLVAREYLSGPPLELATALFEAPATGAVLDAQARLDGGDGSRYGVFYSRAARFWAAIDAALTTRANRSGKLAALIKQTRGLAGVNWRDPDSIARYLDPHTGGRASGIVRCYLVDDLCSADTLEIAPRRSARSTRGDRL